MKHLRRHEEGRILKTIIYILEEDIGYDVRAKVICSSSWVPQKRQRIFIMGFEKPTQLSFDDFIIPNGKLQVLGDILEQEVDAKYTLTEHLWRYLRDYWERYRKTGNGFGYSTFGPDDVARTLSTRNYKDGAEILVRQEGKRPRRLSPRGCSCLVGYDEPDGCSFKIPVSDTQAYRKFGNALVVPLIRALGGQLRPYLLTAIAGRDGLPIQMELSVA